MDIRVGVLQHTLLQAKLKERTEQSRAGMAPVQDDRYDVFYRIIIWGEGVCFHGITSNLTGKSYFLI